MNKKLTLTLDAELIEQAKLHAKKHNISLFKLAEWYLQALQENKTKKVEITPLVKS